MNWVDVIERDSGDIGRSGGIACGNDGQIQARS